MPRQRLRLDLIVRSYMDDEWRSKDDRWTWRLWAGSRIVSSSGDQLYSRRADCVRGAEVGAGLSSIDLDLRIATRWSMKAFETVPVRILDERTP